MQEKNPNHRHVHDCKNSPTDLAPNLHVSDCGYVFEVLRGDANYVEALAA
jgi:hypothetical protein